MTTVGPEVTNPLTGASSCLGSVDGYLWYENICHIFSVLMYILMVRPCLAAHIVMANKSFALKDIFYYVKFYLKRQSKQLLSDCLIFLIFYLGFKSYFSYSFSS